MPCSRRKTRAKSLIFSHIHVKKIMFYTEFLTRKYGLRIFALVSLVKKDWKLTFLIKIPVFEIVTFV